MRKEVSMALNELETKISLGGYALGDARFSGSVVEQIVREHPEWVPDGVSRYTELGSESPAVGAAADAYQTEQRIVWDNLNKIRETAGDILSGDIRGATVSSALADIGSAFKKIEHVKPVAVPAVDYSPDTYCKVNLKNDLQACFGLGMRTGCLYVIGGYTGCGKSAFALNLLQNLKPTDGMKSLYINMENDRTETFERLHQFPKIGDFDIIDGQLEFSDAVRFIESEGYRFTVIDQLSFFDVNCRADDLRIKYKSMCQELADLARRTNGIIVLCAQLNRSYMGRFSEDTGDDDGAWRKTFSEMDETVFAESSDITRPAQAAVIVTRHNLPDSPNPAYWVVNVKSRSGDPYKCGYYPIVDGIVAGKFKIYKRY
jgi:energy-coupling factor transporter ATP-binding protein EcfA2